jgi:hypothetical protein
MQCKTDSDIPPPLDFRARDSHTEHQPVRNTFNRPASESIQDRAQTDESSSLQSAELPGPPQLEKEDHPHEGTTKFILDDSAYFSSDTRRFPCVRILATVAGDSREKVLIGMLDTGASLCVIPEGVVANRFGLDRIDRTKMHILNSLGGPEIRTLGTVEMTFRPQYGRRLYRTSFHVLPNGSLKYRYDVVLSASVIRRAGLLAISVLDGGGYAENKRNSANISVGIQPLRAYRSANISVGIQRLGAGRKTIAPSSLEAHRVPLTTKSIYTGSGKESGVSSAFSGTSGVTLMSPGTDFSKGGETTAAQELFLFIAYDDFLRPLFVAAPHQSGLSAEDFEAKLRVLLKKFARELQPEAESKIERQAIPFIYQYAGWIAHKITGLVYWEAKASDLNISQPNTRGATAAVRETDAEDEENEDIPNVQQSGGDIHDFSFHVEQFLSSSNAFAKLRESLSSTLSLESLSWAGLKDQWKRETHFHLPDEVQRNCSIKVLTKDKVTWRDKIKIALELYSEEEWLWNLSGPPRRPIPKDKLRIQWQCVGNSTSIEFNANL